MKVNKIDDTILVDFDRNDLERLGRGEVTVRELVNEAIATQIGAASYEQANWQYQQRDRARRFSKPGVVAGHWYRISPALGYEPYCCLTPGIHKVTKVEGFIFQFEDDQGSSKNHDAHCYTFTPVPVADAIEAWKDSLAVNMQLQILADQVRTDPYRGHPQAGHWYYIRRNHQNSVIADGAYKVTTVNDDGRVFWIHNEPTTRSHSTDCYTFSPLPIHDMFDATKITLPPKDPRENVRRISMQEDVHIGTFKSPIDPPYQFLRVKFVPASYSKPGALRCVQDHVFNDLQLQRIRQKFDPFEDIMLRFMRDNGYGEYFFQTGKIDGTAHRTVGHKWSAFYLPDDKGDPSVWFPAATEGWHVRSYTRWLSGKPTTGWYISNDEHAFLWKDGVVYQSKGTGFNGDTMLELTDAPGYFASEEIAKRFLIAWANQDRKPYKDWVLHTYNVTVVMVGDVKNVTLFALDLYEVAETICDEYPTCRVIHVEDTDREKLGVDSL